MRASWVLLGCVACAGSSTSEAPPEEVLGTLIEVTNLHRVGVQESYDLEEIQDLEAVYSPDWADATGQVRLMLNDVGCLDAAADDGITADAWLSTLAGRVADHVAVTHDHWAFSQCWNAEDDHHHEMASAIESVEDLFYDCY